MKGSFYPKMISSKLFTTLLKYKVNDNNYNKTCEQLLNNITNTFESEKFTYIFNIVDAEYTYKHDISENSTIEIVVMIYATVDTKLCDKTVRKLFAEFVDDNCAEFEDVPVELISRDIAV